MTSSFCSSIFPSSGPMSAATTASPAAPGRSSDTGFADALLLQATAAPARGPLTDLGSAVRGAGGARGRAHHRAEARAAR